MLMSGERALQAEGTDSGTWMTSLKTGKDAKGPGPGGGSREPRSEVRGR